MKKMLSVLFLSFVAIPVLTVSQASANDGDGRRQKEDQLTRGNQRIKYGERDRDFRGYNGHRLDDGPNTPVPGNSTPSGGGQSAPLDGGLSLLLAAGIGLGVKKASMRKANRQKTIEIPE